MEKGNIGSWSVKVGDKIGPGDVLCSIETDKATMDFEMQDEGYVAKLLYEEGTKDIPLGKLLAILVDDEDDIAAFANYTDDGAGAAPAAPQAAAAPTPAAAAPTPSAAPATPAAAAAPSSSGERIFISPMAQNMANA
jgi:pyruvate dehydrogenase E2 component (dihydrolipoamide acetyltransferase)